MSKYYNLKVKEVVKETPDAITIHFKQPLFRKIKYKSGQFLTLLVPKDGAVHRRSYSICTAPNLDSTVAVTVKRVEGGLVSNLLNDTVKEGDKIEVMEPMGTFVINSSPELSRDIALVGGGSGITPLMSILKSTLAYESESRVFLAFANRDKENIIFREKLDELAGRYPDRLFVKHFFSDSSDTDVKAEAKAGMIDKADISELFGKLRPSHEIYLCGPGGLMEMAKEAFLEAGAEEQKVHRESFVAEKNDSAALSAADIQTQTVTIQLGGTDHSVSVSPNKNILDAALDDGIDMPFSCQSGLCTACRGKCVSGQVFMDEADALTQDERDEGYILTCQAHPMSDDVRIEMG